MAKKRKTTAKRRTAAKRQTAHAVKATAKATNTAAAWANKGANEWAKQSAKLYQLPFQAEDVNEATKKAAATVQSATENMMKASTDMMQQMFGGQPVEQWKELWANGKQQFDNAAAQAKFGNFQREAGEQLNKTAANAQRAIGEANELTRENVEVVMECFNTAVTVSKELGAELINYSNRTFATNVELSKEILSCRTLNDMFDLSGKFVKTNLDSFFNESVKLSEMLFQCATDVSEPLNVRFSTSADRLSKTLAA